MPRHPRPVTDADREAVKTLHARGLARNAIARELQRSPETISKLARQMGLTFVRAPEVAAATEARKIDSRARRAAIAQGLLEDVERLRAQLFAPARVHNFGGKDNSYNEHMLEQPPFRDQYYLMGAIGNALDRAVRLDAYDKAEGAGADIDLWLAAMAGGK